MDTNIVEQEGFFEMRLTNGSFLMTNGESLLFFIFYICVMKSTAYRNYLYYYILLWVMLASLFFFQYINQVSWTESIIFSVILFTPTAVVTNYLSNNLLPKAVQNRNMKRFVFQFIIISLLQAFFHFIMFITFEKLEQMGVFEQSELMRTHFHPIIEYVMSVPAVVTINIGFCGIRFYFEHTQLQEVHLKTQLQVLQQQINPHFMFNVLNHIYILMQKDVNKSSELLVKYSEILRYQLYNGKEELVPLGQEIQFLKDVIAVEKMRWGDELKVREFWDIEDQERKIQPLLLISFVENAFKHVSRSISETGYINILLRQKGNDLRIEVENSKSVRQPKKNKSSGMGLTNIKERLGILYPHKHKLLIEESEMIYIIRLNITL
ncbi:sensor histidine kinase [Prevotella sp. 10(H)]|uniref:sensor histidine kinase n=1 Tax=Prevotella sp. 10(H) TaxID=1158294 RepID=UPI00068ACAAD|nr:histidine kinase [Prevotella sp. 10(H)]